MKTIFPIITLCAMINICAHDNYQRIPTKHAKEYLEKIQYLDQRIEKLNKQKEWQAFDLHYNYEARTERLNQIKLTGFILMSKHAVSELGSLIDHNNPEWDDKKQKSLQQLATLSDQIHLFALKDQYESKKVFLAQYKTSCCIIQ